MLASFSDSQTILICYCVELGCHETWCLILYLCASQKFWICHIKQLFIYLQTRLQKTTLNFPTTYAHEHACVDTYRHRHNPNLPLTHTHTQPQPPASHTHTHNPNPQESLSFIHSVPSFTSSGSYGIIQESINHLGSLWVSHYIPSSHPPHLSHLRHSPELLRCF